MQFQRQMEQRKGEQGGDGEQQRDGRRIDAGGKNIQSENKSRWMSELGKETRWDRFDRARQRERLRD